jgi:hypothetical protein
VDFGEVDVDGDIDDVYNEMDDDNEDDEYLLKEAGNGADVDGGKISRGAICQQNEDTRQTPNSNNPVLANS